MNSLEKLIKLLDDHPEIWDEERSYDRNEFLKMGGSIDDKCYFIISGSVRAFILDGEDEMTIRLGYQNNLIGAIDSFFTGKPSDLYIQALKKTEVKSISREKIQAFFNEHKEHLVLWNEILQMLIVQQLEREQDILKSAPKERYERVLARSPQLFQEIPHKFIASYLRMTPETLSRLKKS